MDQLQSNELEAALFKAFNNLSNKATLDAIRLDYRSKNDKDRDIDMVDRAIGIP